jgi:glycosyltransferase involved in cell wall biosynthesis
VAGDGPDRQSLESSVRRSQLDDRILFTGWVSGEEKDRLFAMADIYCLPSRYDSFSMGLVEAMAHGLPVVVLASGSMSSIIIDGETGLLVERADPAEVAGALMNLSDAEKRERLGAAARRWALDNLAAARVGERIRQALETGKGT